VTRDHLIVAISTVLEHGDEDNQPWALYEDDYLWTPQLADIERSNFIEAVIAKVEELSK
jgi:hypothetical protein